MGLITSAIERRLDRNQIEKSYRTSPKRGPNAATAVIPNNGRVGKANVNAFRQWARGSEFIRTAHNILKDDVSGAEWSIVQFDKDGPKPAKRLQREITRLFLEPDEGHSFKSFIEPYVEDILTLDAGSIEKDRSLDGRLRQLHIADGGEIKVNAFWDGDPDESRYFWYPGNQEKASFKNRDFIYTMSNAVSYSPLGISPLETLKLSIEALLYGDDYNSRQLRGAAPDGVMDLGEGADQDSIDDFREYWMAEIAGKGAIGFIGGTSGAKFINFRSSNREMQYIEWLVWLARKVAIVYGLSPQDFGLTMDINRANAEQQSEHSEARGARPLLSLVQDELTRKVVWDPSFGGSSNNLAFRFTALNLKETLTRAQQNKLALAGVPWKTPNEARRDDGREPLGPEFDKLIMATPVGAVSLDAVLSAAEAMAKPDPAQTPGGEQKPANDRPPASER